MYYNRRDITLEKAVPDDGGGFSRSLTTENRDSESAFAEEEQYCSICGSRPAEKHHWCHTRGAGGGDEPWNILWLCRRHHLIAHAMGRDSFFEQYRGRLSPQRVREWRERRGEMP